MTERVLGLILSRTQCLLYRVERPREARRTHPILGHMLPGRGDVVGVSTGTVRIALSHRTLQYFCFYAQAEPVASSRS